MEPSCTTAGRNINGVTLSLVIYSNDSKSTYNTVMCILIFTSAVYTINKLLNQVRYPLRDNKNYFPHTQNGVYLATEENEIVHPGSGTVVYTFNLSTEKADTGGYL